MTETKINDRKMLRLIDRDGCTQAEAARVLGVSRQAVSKRLQELRGRTTRAIVAKKVDAVIEQKLDTVQQLTKINQHANSLLDLCVRCQTGDKEAFKLLTNEMGLGSSDPNQLALKAMSEIRAQLRLQLEIYQSLYDMQAVKEFQDAVLTTIAEVSPDVRDEILQKLNKARSVRSAVRLY